MNFSTVVRTSFVLSGLLGIRFEGVPNGRGDFVTLEATVPFRTRCFKQPQSVTIINSLPNMGPNPATQTVGQRKPFKEQRPFNKSIKMSAKFPNLSAMTTTPTFVYSKEPEIKKQLPTKNIEMVNNPEICGKTRCTEKEICITWKEIDESKSSLKPLSKRARNSTSSPVFETKIYSECQKNDGLFHININPNETKLCPDGQTHNIQSDPQPCLRDEPPCPLIWNYKCVDNSESPHSCDLRKCPVGGCVEQIICGLQPPCFLQAVCLQGLLG